MTEKFKILTISDSPILNSGVGTQTKYLFDGLLATGKYQVKSFGSAIKHPSYSPQKFTKWGDDWIIQPINGYCDEPTLRSALDSYKPDALWIMSDARFYYWLFGMVDEISNRGIPLLWSTIWDNTPTPKFNHGFYDSCNFLGCISKLTHKIVCELGCEDRSKYIAHAVDSDIFKQYSEQEILDKRARSLGDNKKRFIIGVVGRNARRKMTPDILKAVKMFIDEVGQDKAMLLMHGDPHDPEGSNLHEVGKMLGLTNNQLAFSSGRIPPEALVDIYNISDVVVNISSQEGFGLSCLESLSCGTPVIINKTGGLQDQAVDQKTGEEYGVIIEPATRSLTGSQSIPYIFLDTVTHESVVEALHKMYNMSRGERRKLGSRAREHTLRTFSMRYMIDSWDEAFTKCITESRENGNKNRIKTDKI